MTTKVYVWGTTRTYSDRPTAGGLSVALATSPWWPHVQTTDDLGRVTHIRPPASIATDAQGRWSVELVHAEGVQYTVTCDGVTRLLDLGAVDGFGEPIYPEGAQVEWATLPSDFVTPPPPVTSIELYLEAYASDQVPDAVAAYLGANSGLITDSATAAGAAAGGAAAAAMLATMQVDVAAEGCVLDGVTDNRVALQAAADKARALGVPLHVPPGRLAWSGEVKFYTSSRWEGSMVYDSTSADPPLLTIARTTSPTTTPGAGLGGLTAGSTVVTGLGGAVGCLVLTSTQELIKRDGGTAYTKQEACSLDATGRVMPPLAHTYDPALTTATIYPAEAPVEVDGLSVEVVGSGSPTTGAGWSRCVEVSRDGTTVRGFSASGGSADLTTALRIRSCVGVRVEQPVIEGFMQAGYGYGVFASLSSDVEVIQPRISRCRHTVTSTYAKAVTVRGGSLSGAFDAHWATGMTLDGVAVSVAAGESVIQVAGADLTVRDCTLTGGRSMIGIREDTPELAGAVRVTGTTWRPGTSDATVWVIGGTSLNNASTFAFGRTLTLPSDVTIDGLTIITAGTTGFARVLSDTARSWSRTNWGRVRLSRIAHSGPALFSAATYELSGRAAGSPPLSLTVRECDFTASATDHVYLSNTEEAAAGARLSIIDCLGTMIKMPEVGVASLLVRGGTLVRLYRTATAAAPSLGQIALEGVEATALAVSGLFEWDLRGVTWSGAATSSNKTMDGRTRSVTGGILRRVGATGTPTQADGYKSATYYA